MDSAPMRAGCKSRRGDSGGRKWRLVEMDRGKRNDRRWSLSMNGRESELSVDERLAIGRE